MINSESKKKNAQYLNDAFKNRFSIRLNSHDPKRNQLQGQRITEIERANKILFDHITNILKGGLIKKTATEAYDAQFEFTNKLRRYKTKFKNHNEFGLPPDKAKELRKLIAKEHNDKFHEQQMIVEEISEKLPILVKEIPSKSLNNSNLQSEQSHRTLTTPNYSSKSKNPPHLKEPRERQLSQRDRSFDAKRDNSIFDESQDIHNQNFLEPSTNNESSFIDISNKSQSNQKEKQNSYRKHSSPLRQKENSSYENQEKPKILHKKAHMIHNQLYFVEITKVEGFMIISAANQSRTKTAMKKIINDEAMDILHDFKYNFENLCMHLKIKDENIDIVPPDTEIQANPKKKANLKSNKSFDDHLRNSPTPEPSKPKVMLVNKELFDRLAKPKLRLRTVTPDKEIKIGSSSYHKNSQKDVSQRKKSPKLVESLKPLVLEYSSYGRKLNAQQGKDGIGELPWSGENPLKIKNQKVLSNDLSPVEREEKIQPKNQSLLDKQQNINNFSQEKPNKEVLDNKRLPWEEDTVPAFKKKIFQVPDKITNANVNQTKLQQFSDNEPQLGSYENSTQFQKKIKNTLEKPEILYQEDFLLDLKHNQKTIPERNISPTKIEAKKQNQTQFSQLIEPKSNGLNSNVKEKLVDHSTKEESQKITKKANYTGNSSEELFQKDFVLAGDYKINKSSLSSESLPHSTTNVQGKEKSIYPNEKVANDLHKNLVRDQKLNTENAKSDRKDPKDTNIADDKGERALKDGIIINDTGPEVKQQTQSVEKLDLEEVEKLLNGYDVQKGLSEDIQKENKDKDKSLANFEKSSSEQKGKDILDQIDKKNHPNGTEIDNSKRNIPSGFSPRSAGKSSKRYSAFQEANDDEETKVESFVSNEKLVQVIKENPSHLSRIDHIVKDDDDKKDFLPPIDKTFKTHKINLKGTLEPEKEKNTNILLHNGDQNNNTKKEDSPDSHKKENKGNADSIQALHTANKKATKHEDDDFDIEDFELPE